MDKTAFQNELIKDLKTKYGTDIENAESYQLHECISSVVMEYISEDWNNSLEPLFQQTCLLSFNGISCGQSNLQQFALPWNY